MKKQILLLLGLVLIGTLGLAVGIEASKGTWDYRSLSRGRASVQSVQVTAPVTAATKRVSSLAVPECTQNDSASRPFVRFVLKRAEGQQDMVGDQATCTTATDDERTKAKKISLCLGCPGEDASEVGLESLSAPQGPPSSSGAVPGDPEAIRFIG
jgi:hypothetical protein